MEMEMEEYIEELEKASSVAQRMLQFFETDQHLLTVSSVTKCLGTCKTDSALSKA
jgi:hypothetical protein